MTIALALVLPLLLGLGVDRLAHSSPIGVLVGLLIGIGAACFVAFVQFRRYI
jgi:F0F1-type ATP synthase assembly protein I